MWSDEVLELLSKATNVPLRSLKVRRDAQRLQGTRTPRCVVCGKDSRPSLCDRCQSIVDNYGAPSGTETGSEQSIHE